MRTAVSTLEVLQPRSLAEALRMLDSEPKLRPIAGCTDVMVAMNAGTEGATRFLDLWGLQPLRKIEVRRDVLVLGALATYTQMIRSPVVRRRLPMLVAASGEVGGVQIQNRGTLGGNIANASPAGDTLPVLAAAEATVVARSVAGTRRIAFADFYTGYRETALRRDELIVAVEVPRVRGRQWFRKVGTRAAQAISKVVVAAVRSQAPRFAVGSVGPTVIRATRTEAALAAGASIADARQILDREITPIDDVRSTARYRSRVTGNLLARFWQDTEGRG